MEGFSSKIIHSRPYKADVHGSLRMPVYDSASFELDSAEDLEKAFNGRKPAHLYSRSSNPTVEFFEKQVKDVTGATGVLALSSGMAAISNTILALCSAGDNIITSTYLFGNTYSLFTNTLKPWGLNVQFTDFSEPRNLIGLINEKTRLIFLETVTNPQLQVADLIEISRIADEKGILLVVDSTITPFAFGNMKNLGVHIELLSSTKYISGGATSVGGLIIDYGKYNWSNLERYKNDYPQFGPFTFFRKLRRVIYRDLGSSMAPHNAYLQSLGLETFQLRVEKSSSNAIKIVQFLKMSKGIRSVSYPENTDQFGGLGGGLLTFELASKSECFKFINSLKMIRKATNLNDNKTLIIHPSSTIFCEYSDEEKKSMSVSEGLIRLAVGIEEVEDIISDLDNGLEAIK
jgi:O-acetylhomoserine (thiol)-lyase